jgi:hypothetical protein
MIDIDASIEAIETHPSFWVKFLAPDEEQEPIAFEMKAAPRQQRRIVDRYIRMSAAFRPTDPAHAKEDTQAETPHSMEINADWHGMAQALSEYIIGWEGFKGTFDRAKVKKWLEIYGSYAIAFAQNFKGVLDKFEADLNRQKDLEIKN